MFYWNKSYLPIFASELRLHKTFLVSKYFDFEESKLTRLRSTYLIYITLKTKTTKSADSECTSSTTAERV